MEVTEEELDIQISKCDKDFVEAMKLAKRILKISINFKDKMDIYFKKKWESI